MSYICISENNKKFISDFLRFPRTLYSRKNLTQDIKLEKEILLGSHLLSKYFTVKPFLVKDDMTGRALARCLITYYENDDNAYFGFFESTDDLEAVKALFERIDQVIIKDGKNKLVGPLDASFWIKYRLKTNHFEGMPYTGEPYNLEYYYELLKNVGFTVRDRYVSNSYRAVPKDYFNDKYNKRFSVFKEKGYSFKAPTKETYDSVVENIYELLIELYSDFPTFKYIEKQDFCRMFKAYKLILNFKMVKLAYYNDEMVGFLISVPDYGNSTCNINLVNLIRLFGVKKKPDRYVILYLGVQKAHSGLGTAMTFEIINELKETENESIGALVHDGKVTKGYAGDLIENEYEYVLLEKGCK